MKYVIFAIGLGLVCPVGLAQSPATTVPTVTSEGEAYVSTEPMFVDFRMTFTQRAESTTAEAAASALAFPDKVRVELEELSLKPSLLDTTGVQIRRITAGQATASVRLRFPIIRFASDEDKLTAFAALADDMLAIAEKLECVLSAPELIVENAQETEQQTVSRATENALYKADAVASLIQSQIYAVQEVEVLETEWLHDAAADSDHPPTPGNLTCRARVRVVYLISPGA